MYAVMQRSHRTTALLRCQQPAQKFHWRTPPLRWRQWFVGSLLAMPGAVGGLILALALPLQFAPLLLVAGAIAGLHIGFKMENR